MAAVGHSAGGQISPGIAVRARDSGLPPIRAVMAVEPGISWGPKHRNVPLDNMHQVPASTLLLAVVGDRDQAAGDIDAKRMVDETTQIPPQNKNLVTFVTDDHSVPPLQADHFFPVARTGVANQGSLVGDDFSALGSESGEGSSGPIRQLIKQRVRLRIVQRMKEQARPQGRSNTREQAGAVNALDYYGLWKLFDALEDAAFYNKNREYALGNTPQQRNMGKWSDGVPVKEPIVSQGAQPVESSLAPAHATIDGD